MTQLNLESVRDRALLMRAMPTFAGVDDDSLALIAAHARTRVFPPGATLTRENQPIEEVYAIVRGRVEVRRQGEVVQVPDPSPATVGLLPVLVRDTQGFDSIAIEETVALALPPQVLLDVLEEHFPVVRELLRIGARALLGRLRAIGERQSLLGELLFALPGAELAPSAGIGRGGRVEMLMRLRQVPLMETADLDAMFAILDHQDLRVLAPGETLWRIGDIVDFTVMIETGRLRAEMPGCPPVILGERMMAGRLESLASEPVRYQVVAEVETHLLRIDMSGVMSVLESHFDLARKILAGVSAALLGLPPDQLVEGVRRAGVR